MEVNDIGRQDDAVRRSAGGARTRYDFGPISVRRSIATLSSRISRLLHLSEMKEIGFVHSIDEMKELS